MKKILASFLILLFLAGTLALFAGGKQETAEKEQINLIVWHHAGGHKPVIDGLAAEYQKTHPNISVTQTIFKSYMEATTAVKTAMVGKTGVDIAMEAQGGPLIELAQNDLVVDLTPYYNKDPDWKNSFYRWVLDEMTVDCKITGTTVATNGVQIFYNVNLFKELGLKEPATLDELKAVNQKVKTKVRTGLGFTAAQLENAAYPFWWAGGQIAGNKLLRDADIGKARWDDPKIVESMKYAEEICHSFFDKETAALNEPNMISGFLSGSIGMIIGGMWLNKTFIAGNAQFEIGLFPFPSVKPGVTKPNAFSALGVTFGVAQHSKHKEEAIDFIKYITSGERKLEYITQMKLLPTGPVDPGKLKARVDAANDPIWSEFVAASEVGTLRFLFTPELDLAIGRGVQRMILKEATADDLIKEAQQINDKIGKRNFTLGLCD